MTAVNAHTRLVGLIGWPVDHSLSPTMHNAAFEAMELNWVYLPLAVNPEVENQVSRAVLGLAALGFAGANITIPHKQAVMPYLDEITESAMSIGAVNTVHVAEDGRLKGDNTDAAGFLADLNEHNIDLREIDALVIGAGGAARAVIFALAQAGAHRITVLGRTPARAIQLVGAMQRQFPKIVFAAYPFDNAFETQLPRARFIVNCTPLGMTGHEDSLSNFVRGKFTPDQIIYDLVYGPRNTSLIDHAKECGARAFDGLGMLVHQGALSLEIWSGRPAPIEVMRRAAEARLGLSSPRP